MGGTAATPAKCSPCINGSASGELATPTPGISVCNLCAAGYWLSTQASTSAPLSAAVCEKCQNNSTNITVSGNITGIGDCDYCIGGYALTTAAIDG